MSKVDVAQQLETVAFAGYGFEIRERLLLGDRVVYELNIKGTSSHFPELAGTSLVVVCDCLNSGDFLHQLASSLISRSDRYIEESLEFKGFTRFSHQLDPIKLAEFSYQTRNVEISDSRFDKGFEDMSYKVDASKAPFYNDGELGRKQRALVASFDNLGGYLPLGK